MRKRSAIKYLGIPFMAGIAFTLGSQVVQAEEEPALQADEQSGDPVIRGDASVTESGGSMYNTESQAVYETETGATLDFQASLDVKDIKGQIDSATSMNPAYRPIRNSTSTFVTELTVPDGLDFSSATYSLASGESSLVPGRPVFVLGDVTRQGNVITIPMVLNVGDEELKTFGDLYQTIYTDAPDNLLLKIMGVKVTAPEGSTLTISGKVTGEMSAEVYWYTYGIWFPIAYSWDSIQDMDVSDIENVTGAVNDSGRDFVLGADGPIQLTLHTAAKEEPAPVPKNKEIDDRPKTDKPSLDPVKNVKPKTTDPKTDAEAAKRPVTEAASVKPETTAGAVDTAVHPSVQLYMTMTALSAVAGVLVVRKRSKNQEQ